LKCVIVIAALFSQPQGGPVRTVRALVVGGVLVAGAVTVPAAYAATTPPPTGYVKICEAAASTSVTGSFSFTVSGVRTPVVVPVGTCSKAIATTLRRVTVTEATRSGFVASKIAVKPAGRTVSSNIAKATVTVKVPAGGITSRTTVTFTNAVAPPPSTGSLRICEAAVPGVAPDTLFPLTIGTVGTRVRVGTCGDPIPLPVGNVTVRQTATAGLTVGAIAVTGTGSLVSSDLATGTAVVKVAAGLSTVTYTNHG
jgi:hypothetical protein